MINKSYEQGAIEKNEKKKPCIFIIQDTQLYKTECWNFFLDITLYRQDDWSIVNAVTVNL